MSTDFAVKRCYIFHMSPSSHFSIRRGTIGGAKIRVPNYLGHQYHVISRHFGVRASGGRAKWRRLRVSDDCQQEPRADNDNGLGLHGKQPAKVHIWVRNFEILGQCEEFLDLFLSKKSTLPNVMSLGIDHGQLQRMVVVERHRHRNHNSTVLILLTVSRDLLDALALLRQLELRINQRERKEK